MSPALEKCVDEGCGASGSESHKQADQSENQQNWYEPPLFVFSDKSIIGLPEILKENKNCQVIDYMKPKSLTTPHLQHLETKDSFVNKVFIRKDHKTAPIQIEYDQDPLARYEQTRFWHNSA